MTATHQLEKITETALTIKNPAMNRLSHGELLLLLKNIILKQQEQIDILEFRVAELRGEVEIDEMENDLRDDLKELEGFDEEKQNKN